MNNKKIQVSIRDITQIAMMVAVIEACKVALMHIPNIELTTFWLIIFAIFFGKKIFFVIPVFVLIEGFMFGFGIWWIMYLYLWPSLAIVALIFKKNTSALTWSIIAGIYGLLFGFFGALPYIFIGSIGADITAGLSAAFTWWISGIPWDLVHGIGNFVIMLVLYHPITRVMKYVKRT